VPVPDAIVVAADVFRSVTTRRQRVVAPPGTRRAGSRIADLRDEVGGTAGLVLSVDHQVLAALGTGRTAYAISVLLGCSERTVHRHLQSIYCKLGTHDWRVTVARAREMRLI
jgi:DNA-binding CsgD family transcriptional regulator